MVSSITTQIALRPATVLRSFNRVKGVTCINGKLAVDRVHSASRAERSKCVRSAAPTEGANPWALGLYWDYSDFDSISFVSVKAPYSQSVVSIRLIVIIIYSIYYLHYYYINQKIVSALILRATWNRAAFHSEKIFVVKNCLWTLNFHSTTGSIKNDRWQQTSSLLRRRFWRERWTNRREEDGKMLHYSTIVGACVVLAMMSGTESAGGYGCKCECHIFAKVVWNHL
jgi:hypothetical protein